MGWLWSSESPQPSSPALPDPPNPREQATDPQDQALSEFLTSLDAPLQRKAPIKEEETLYPTSMSCTSCFDQAYYCSSLGGQLTNIYRYGGMRSCSDLWAQWRFCMRTKAMSEDTAKDRIREFEKAKAAKYKMGRSSEDVWKVRTKAVDGAFAGNIEEVADFGRVGY